MKQKSYVIKRSDIIISLCQLAVCDVQPGYVVHLTCGVLGDNKVVITLWFLRPCQTSRGPSHRPGNLHPPNQQASETH